MNRTLVETESQAQRNLFKWAKAMTPQIPELALLFHIPNGGHRDIRVAARMKAEGVKAGVPDVMLPVPRGGFQGLFIEMKSPKGRLSKSQLEWLTALREQAYCVFVCVGSAMATDVVREYLYGRYKP